MTDLLTHVLVGYVVGVAVVRVADLPDRLVPLVPVGAAAPDAMRVAVFADALTGEVGGVTYSLWGVHTLGGVVLLSGLGALTVRASDRAAALGALAVGGCSHLLLDLLVVRVDGRGPPYLVPLTDWLPPAGNLYTSTDLWPLAVALAVAVPVWLVRERVARRDPNPTADDG